MKQGELLPKHDTWDILDATKIDDFITCARLFFFVYVLGWKSDRPNNHLVFGGAWHKAMEHLLLHGYGELSLVEACDVFLRHYRNEFSEDTDDLFEPKSPSTAIKALARYVLEYPRDLEDYEVLYTEISGTVPIDLNRVLHFKMDSILREIAPLEGPPMVCSFEHKTKGGYKTSQWENQWILSPQNGIYHHVLYCLYLPEEIAGVKINGVFLANTKTKGVTINFARVPVHKPRDSMRVWFWNTLHWMDEVEREFQRLQECDDSDPVLMAFPMNPRGCTQYFGCPFHDYCIAWPNPLRKCDQPPLGFKVEYWDPRAIQATHHMELDGMIKVLEKEMVASEIRNESSKQLLDELLGDKR